MRRLVIPSLALAALSGVSTTYAQSSVTLYGEIDNAFAYYNNVGGHSLFAMQGADLTANEWGIKGKEDLGGGYSAIFNLENGFDINTGTLRQGGREFGKNAWVGLASKSLGTITMGRQLDPTVDLVQPITADPYGPAFTTPGDADNNDNTFRIDNSIKYTSPIYGGLQYELMYALGGVAGSVSSQDTISGAAAYTRGPLSVAAGYIFAKNDGAAGVGTADLTHNNSVTPLFGSVSFVGSRQIAHVAAQYVIGPFTANIRYSNAQWKPYIKLAAFNRTETFNTGGTSLQYLVTPALALNAGFVYTRSTGASSATYHTVAASTEYYLSKRTTLYAISAYSHARGTTFNAAGTGIVSAAGSIGDLESSSGTPSQVAVILGITTKF
jgi:predicted porin